MTIWHAYHVYYDFFIDGKSEHQETLGFFINKESAIKKSKDIYRDHLMHFERRASIKVEETIFNEDTGSGLQVYTDSKFEQKVYQVVYHVKPIEVEED